jgi:hypothetical protein
LRANACPIALPTLSLKSLSPRLSRVRVVLKASACPIARPLPSPNPLYAWSSRVKVVLRANACPMACPAPSPGPLHPNLSSTSARSFYRSLSQIVSSVAALRHSTSSFSRPAVDKPILKGPLELWHHELMPDTKQQPRLYTSIFQRIFHAFSLAHSVASPILRHAWQRVARIRVLVSLSLSLSPSLSGFRLRAWRSQKKQTTVSGSCAVEHK